jgi:hypothetical protein
MVYDAALMRSILALGLAALILAAHAPGLFVETPVCAAVDGVRVAAGGGDVRRAGIGFLWHKVKGRPQSPSCCGTPDCPMHLHGCGKTAACTMNAAYGPEAKIASAAPGSSRQTKLCAPSCGRDGARMMPGAPDPGTLDLMGSPVPQLAESGCTRGSSARAPKHRPDPVVPPPRS